MKDLRCTNCIRNRRKENFKANRGSSRQFCRDVIKDRLGSVKNFRCFKTQKANFKKTHPSEINLSETLNLSGTNLSGTMHLSGTTFNATPLKRKTIQKISFPGSPINQIRTLTGPIQKIYLQNENQTSQEIIIDSLKAEELEVERSTAIKEMGVSGEAQPVSGDKVSKESGEATPDKGLRSTSKLFTKKIQRRRIGKEIKYAAFFAKFLHEWQEQ